MKAFYQLGYSDPLRAAANPNGSASAYFQYASFCAGDSRSHGAGLVTPLFLR